MSLRRSKVLARWRAGQPARLCSLGIFHPPYIAHAAANGYDAIWVDMEHKAFTATEIKSLLTYFHLYDIDCLLRPSTTDKIQLYRYLEDGATGLMIPHCNTPEIARQLVQCVKFPPLGQRGLDGAGFDGNFYMHDGADYPAFANRETFLVVQIETPEAIANVDAIAAVEGVDCLFIGPGDLGLRIKHAQPGYDLAGAARRVAAAAKKHGKQWGQPAGSAEHLRELLALGGTLLNHGSDFMALKTMLEERGREWTKVLADKLPSA